MCFPLPGMREINRFVYKQRIFVRSCENSAVWPAFVSKEKSFKEVREIFELRVDVVGCPLTGNIGEGSRLVEG